MKDLPLAVNRERNDHCRVHGLRDVDVKLRLGKEFWWTWGCGDVEKSTYMDVARGVRDVNQALDSVSQTPLYPAYCQQIEHSLASRLTSGIRALRPLDSHRGIDAALRTAASI